MIKSVCVVITLFICMSCIKEPINVVSFPDKLQLLKGDYDGYFEGVESKYRIVNYNDSIGCLECKLIKLKSWRYIIDYLELYSQNISLIMIYTPKNEEKESLENLLLENMIDYPLYIDYQQNFLKTNIGFDSKKTYLLDRDGNIIWVGEPIYKKRDFIKLTKLIRDLCG